jgi:hypothetical protein
MSSSDRGLLVLSRNSSSLVITSFFVGRDPRGSRNPFSSSSGLPSELSGSYGAKRDAVPWNLFFRFTPLVVRWIALPLAGPLDSLSPVVQLDARAASSRIDVDGTPLRTGRLREEDAVRTTDWLPLVTADPTARRLRPRPEVCCGRM